MSEISKSLVNFHIAGFQYWDGALALSKLKVGKKLTLVAEPDNQIDPSAVALYYKDTKLGYVPQNANEIIAQFIHFGHGGAFECIVLGVDQSAAPWKQVYAGIRITDAR